MKKVGHTSEFLFGIYWWTWWYDLQFPRYIAKQTEIGNFRSFFALLPQKPQKSKFWKMKNSGGDIITLHVCTKNHNQMMYGSWDK